MQTKFNITMRNRNAAMANKRLDARSAEVRLLQPWQMEVILLPWQMEVILQIAEAHRSASTARRRRNAGSVEGRCFVATASESSGGGSAFCSHGRRKRRCKECKQTALTVPPAQVGEAQQQVPTAQPAPSPVPAAAPH